MRRKRDLRSLSTSDPVSDEVEGDRRYRCKQANEEKLRMSSTEWWIKHGGMFPRMRQLALTVLAVQPSTADCEQAFSGAGLVSTRRRAMLHSTTLSRLSFLRINKIKVMQEKAEEMAIDDQDHDSDHESS